MMEIMALAMGLMMTGVAIVIGGFMLDAIFWMLGRSLQPPPFAASSEPADTHLSQVERAVDALNVSGNRSGIF